MLGLAAALPTLRVRAQGAIAITEPGTPSTGVVQVDPNFATLHSFGGPDGTNPVHQGLIQGREGKFYGATTKGGATSATNGPQDGGVVYSITPQGDFALLHAFGAAADAYTFQPGGVIQGQDGRLYGTTAYDDSTGVFELAFSGTAFALGPAGVVNMLFRFEELGEATPPESVHPAGNLCEGLDGNFYGVTDSSPGGVFNTFFRLTPAGALTMLHTFSTTDSPQGSLVRDDAGNFYGSMLVSTSNANGSVFKITPAGVLTILHAFTGGDDGSGPQPLVRGRDGNFYGVTSGTTAANTGTVFKITPDGILTTLYRFTGSRDDYGPNTITQANDGNLYGTTGGLTQVNGHSSQATGGTVFRLTSEGVLTVLHRFGSQVLGNEDGLFPNSLVSGSDGQFYGTTSNGGRSGYGVVFRLTVPGVHPAFFTGETALGNGVYYLELPGTGNVFGYYAYLSDPRYLYHFGFGYEYLFDAGDGADGVYFYDFASGDFFYTSPGFPFPYLYDFRLNALLYYYPSLGSPTPSFVRYFYNFTTGQIITR